MSEELRKFLQEQQKSLEYFAQSWYQEALKPNSWALQAELLRRAAEILWSAFYQDYQRFLGRAKEARPGSSINTSDLGNMYILRIYLLIAGYAIENLLKGLIVKNKLMSSTPSYPPPPNRRLPKNLPSDLRSHDLVKLFKQAELQFKSDEEKDYLDMLTKHIEWAGRYPLPLDWQDLKPDKQLKIPYQLDVVHDMFKSLFNRLFSLYSSRNQ